MPLNRSEICPTHLLKYPQQIGLKYAPLSGPMFERFGGESFYAVHRPRRLCVASGDLVLPLSTSAMLTDVFRRHVGSSASSHYQTISVHSQVEEPQHTTMALSTLRYTDRVMESLMRKASMKTTQSYK